MKDLLIELQEITISNPRIDDLFFFELVGKYIGYNKSIEISAQNKNQNLLPIPPDTSRQIRQIKNKYKLKNPLCLKKLATIFYHRESLRLEK